MQGMIEELWDFGSGLILIKNFLIFVFQILVVNFQSSFKVFVNVETPIEKDLLIKISNLQTSLNELYNLLFGCAKALDV
jgi:hypothetical protein